jgi:hypothetical protein
MIIEIVQQTNAAFLMKNPKRQSHSDLIGSAERKGREEEE